MHKQAVVPCKLCASLKQPCVWSKLGSAQCDKCRVRKQKCEDAQMGPGATTKEPEQVEEVRGSKAAAQEPETKAAAPKAMGEQISAESAIY
jgi:hypothetical protein